MRSPCPSLMRRRASKEAKSHTAPDTLPFAHRQQSRQDRSPEYPTARYPPCSPQRSSILQELDHPHEELPSRSHGPSESSRRESSAALPCRRAGREREPCSSRASLRYPFWLERVPQYTQATS